MTPYTYATDESSKQKYANAWSRFKTLRRISFALWLLFLPYEVLLPAWIDHHLASMFLARVASVAVGWVLIDKLNSFRCPRCGERFDPLGTYSMCRNSFGRRCASCGLPKWGIDEPDN